MDDLEHAKMVAKKFLEQSNPIIIFKDVFLEGKVWMIVIDIGLIDEHIIYIRIDAKTDRVLTCLYN